MPEKWTSPWYNKQYQKSNYDTDANIFIGQGHRGAIPEWHWVRKIGGCSLMRLFDIFKDDFSGEVLYEWA